MFKKYPSIENHYKEKVIDQIRNYGFDHKNITWVATEKVHGTNLSFVANETENGTCVQVAKRSGVINPDESFYESEKMLDRYQANIISVIDLAVEKAYGKEAHKHYLSGNITVQFYGEHYGGYYNGVSAGKTIQKGIQYCPDTDWIVFDIMVNYHDGVVDSKVWLDHDQVVEICKEAGLNVVPEIARGTFDEMLEIDPVFETKIPALHGLEPIEGNYAEGVVLKPNANLVFNNGDRVVLKKKSPTFSEKGGKQKTKQKKETPAHVKKVIDEVSTLATKGRFETVASRIGFDCNGDQKAKGQFASVFFNDMIDDLDDPAVYNNLEKGEKKLVKKAIMPLIWKLINEHC